MIGDDPFENLVRQFFGGEAYDENSQDEVIENEEEERNIDFIETEDKIYLIFEMPGFEESDLSIVVNKKEIIISASAKKSEGAQDYLVKKLREGISFSKLLPRNADYKKYSTSFKNGVLEVAFNRK